MLFETAILNTSGELAKVQFGLDEVRKHEADPSNGRSILTLKVLSQFTPSRNTPTFEAFAVLSARLATLSEGHPVGLMSDADWQAAQAAHGG